MVASHDPAYKLLFAHPQVVKDLLCGFVREDWVEALDFGSLERVNASFVSEDLREREDDILWRVRFQGRWLYVYLLIECQSTVDPWMAVRLLVYVGLLYQDLIRRAEVQVGDKLPPVFPVVLYNGKRPWRAALELAELIEPGVGPLVRYQPNQRYWLLEERAVEAAGLSAGNAMAHIVWLEQSRYPEELRQAVVRLNASLRQPEAASLRRAFAVWIKRVVLRRLLPSQLIPEVEDLQEVETMLAETVEEWTAQWKQEGLQQGLQQGWQEGRLSGEQEALAKFLEARFGPLPQWVHESIAELANEGAIDSLIRAAATAESLEAVFRR